MGKGRRVFIEGRLQTRNWEAQDGTKRYRTEIVGENMIMLDGNSGQDEFSPATPSMSTNPTPAVKKTTPKPEEEISIEDIPF